MGFFFSVVLTVKLKTPALWRCLVGPLLLAQSFSKLLDLPQGRLVTILNVSLSEAHLLQSLPVCGSVLEYSHSSLHHC